MKNKVLLFLLILFSGVSGTRNALAMNQPEVKYHAREDSVIYPAAQQWESMGKERTNTPLFLSLKASAGQVFKTNDFVKGNNAIPFYSAVSLKFGVNSVGSQWQDIAYGMPYFGIGLYAADYGQRDDLGRPVSLYVLQGATITNISPELSLNYEWNLGISMGWKPYDPFTNPQNVAIGSEVNVHVGFGMYLKWNLSSRFDLNIGADLSHFSNGASRMPNSGMNMYSVFAEAVYNFNRGKVIDRYDPTLIAPKYDRHFQSDMSMTISSRQISVDTVGTNLPSKYLDHKFKVLGLNYSLMYAPGYRYRYGLSLDMVYDESAGSWAERKINPYDDKWYDIVHYGKAVQRFGIGVSAKGEVVLPGYTIFANVGVQLYKGSRRDKWLYQIIGVKIYLKENFYGTFGIRAQHFSSAQYLFWSLGYTINHYDRR